MRLIQLKRWCSKSKAYYKPLCKHSNNKTSKICTKKWCKTILMSKKLQAQTSRVSNSKRLVIASIWPWSCQMEVADSLKTKIKLHQASFKKLIIPALLWLILPLTLLNSRSHNKHPNRLPTQTLINLPNKLPLRTRVSNHSHIILLLSCRSRLMISN